MRTARCVLETVGSAVLTAGIAAPSVLGLDAEEIGSAARHARVFQEGAGIAGRLFLEIANVRLQEPPPSVPQPSALLTFDLTNDGVFPVSDVTLRVEVHERQLPDPQAPQRFIVRPFEVRGAVTIEPGFTVQYEMLFRNLASDCECEASVTVVSASAAGELPSPLLPPPRKGA